MHDIFKDALRPFAPASSNVHLTAQAASTVISQDTAESNAPSAITLAGSDNYGNQKAERASPRFSRSFVLSEIEREMNHLEFVYRFKEGDGRSVVEGKTPAVIMAFGAYDALRELHEVFSGDL